MSIIKFFCKQVLENKLLSNKLYIQIKRIGIDEIKQQTDLKGT